MKTWRLPLSTPSRRQIYSDDCDVLDDDDDDDCVVTELLLSTLSHDNQNSTQIGICIWCGVCKCAYVYIYILMYIYMYVYT